MILVLLLSSLIGACIKKNVYNDKTKFNPALLLNCNESCFVEIENVIMKLLSTKNVHISKDIFTDNALLKLSNFKQCEDIHRNHDFLKETKHTKKFLLHKDGPDCILYLINDDYRQTKGTKLKSCNCIKDSDH